MNDLPSSSQPAASSEIQDLREQCANLRWQVSRFLMALFVISGTLNVYFAMEWWHMKKDLAALIPQAAPIIEQAKKEDPAVQDLTKRLLEYGRTHPSFGPIMVKYSLAPAPAPAAAPAADPKK